MTVARARAGDTVRYSALAPRPAPCASGRSRRPSRRAAHRPGRSAGRS
jgi:hypothetical protein